MLYRPFQYKLIHHIRKAFLQGYLDQPFTESFHHQRSLWELYSFHILLDNIARILYIYFSIMFISFICTLCMAYYCA